MSISMSMDIKEEIEEGITEYSTPSCSIESDLCICKKGHVQNSSKVGKITILVTISLGVVLQLVYQPKLGIQLVSILEMLLLMERFINNKHLVHVLIIFDIGWY